MSWEPLQVQGEKTFTQTDFARIGWRKIQIFRDILRQGAPLNPKPKKLASHASHSVSPMTQCVPRAPLTEVFLTAAALPLSGGTPHGIVQLCRDTFETAETPV